MEEASLMERVDALFAGEPAPAEAQLSGWVARDRVAVRRRAVDHLERADLLPAQAAVGERLLRLAGGAGHQRRRLTRLVFDEARAPAGRVAGLIVLLELHGEAWRASLAQRTEEERAGVRGLAVLRLLYEAGGAQALGALLPQVAAGVEAHGRALFAQDIEAARRSFGYAATPVWAPVLRDPELWSLHAVARDALAVEPEGVRLLEALRDAQPDPTARRAAQKQILESRTRTIEARRAPIVPAEVRISTCDGAGFWSVVWSAPDGPRTLTVAGLTLQAGGGLRDGVVLPRELPGRVGELARRFGQAGAAVVVEAPPGLALSLITEARARRTPPGALEALRILDALDVEPAPVVAVTDDGLGLSVPDAVGLLARPGFTGWAFDATEFEAEGVARLPADRGAAVRRAAMALATPARLRRLAATLDHMALWHGLAGQPTVAVRCARARGQLQREGAGSPIFRAMVERSLSRAGVEAQIVYGDPELLGRLARRLVRSGAASTRGTLMQLHLAETAVRSLEAVGYARSVGGGLKLAEAVVSGMIALDRHLPEHRLRRASDPEGALTAIEVMTRSVFDAMAGSVGGPVAHAVMGAAHRYLRAVCLRCPADCLRRDLSEPSPVPLTAPHPLGRSEAPAAPVTRAVGRNAPCPCGSGRKHKRCCGR